MKLIIFDSDGTLYSTEGFRERIQPQIEYFRIDFIADNLGISRHDAEVEKDRIKSIYGENVDIGLKREFGLRKNDYYQFVWGNLDLSGCLGRDLRLRRMLENLEKYNLAVLSNAPYIQVQRVLSELGIVDIFGYVKGCDDGIVKPQEEAFVSICDRFDIPYSETMMVGDTKDLDLDTPRRLGMTTVLVGDEDPNYDYCVSTVCEIEKILGGEID